MVNNTKVVYKACPTGLPNASENFEIIKEELDLDNIELSQDKLLVRNLYISVDPYMRLRMRPSDIESYFPAFNVGESMNGGIVSEVVKSQHDKFK
ncbi:GroES-like protein, partial [Neoconidiobolus thromboides FSU 785]